MMEDIESSNKAYFEKLKPRDYKCPCGKSYLSYAALFTHIKQKHQGKPPGKISKPGGTHQKRGRPPLKAKNISNSQYNSSKLYQKNSSIDYGNLENPIKKHSPNNIQFSNMNLSIDNITKQIEFLLEDIPQQSCRRIHLNEMQAFTEMLVILKRQGYQKPDKSNDKTVMNCLIEYLSCVSQNLKWGRFQQLYILMALYLQFIIDEENNKSVITSASVDIMCEYINDFIQNHLKALAQYYELENMEIMKEHIAIGVFNNFFKWMMLKDYTAYIIHSNAEINKVQLPLFAEEKINNN